MKRSDNISYKGKQEIKISLDEREFSHLHIQIREDDFVLKVLGKRPVVVKTEEEILGTLKWWAKEVRRKNWNGR